MMTEKPKQIKDLNKKFFTSLTIRQPWVSMIFDYGKDFENRKWKCNHWGPLLVHSAKLWDLNGYKYLTEKMEMDIPQGPTRHNDRRYRGQKDGDPYLDMLGYEFRCFSGFLMVEGWMSKHSSKWFQGPYGIVIKDSMRFDEPMRWTRGWPQMFSINAQDLYDIATTEYDKKLIVRMADRGPIG